jgi:orotate phosphoribosyltransferase
MHQSKIQAQNKKENALHKINDVEKKIEESNNADTLKNAMSALSLANEAIKKGDDLFANGNYSEAFFAYQRAHEFAQTAKLLADPNKHEKFPLIKFDPVTASTTVQSTSTIQIPKEIKIKLDDDKNLIKIKLENDAHDKNEFIEKESRGQNRNNENESQRGGDNKSGRQ